MSATIIEVSNAEYHASTPGISSSMLKTILESPANYRDYYVNRTRQRKQTKALTLGSMVDCLVYDPDEYRKLFACRPENIDGRTTAGKEALAKFRLSCIGKLEITPELDAQAHAMADAIRAEPCVAELLSQGEKQKTILWTENGVDYKARLDLFISRPDMPSDLILDTKSAAKPAPQVKRDRDGQLVYYFPPIQNFRYDLQLVHYAKAAAAWTGRPCSTGLVVVGSPEPYDVFLMDTGFCMEAGLAHWQEANRLLTECQEKQEWRSPCQGWVVPISNSPWSFTPDVEVEE